MCNPCRHCTKRNATCHAECMEYKEWAEKERALKKAYAQKHFSSTCSLPRSVVTQMLRHRPKYRIEG